MHHLVAFYATTPVSVFSNVGGWVKKIGGTAVLMGGGLLALKHWFSHKHGAAVGTFLMAMVVGSFFFNAAGVTSLITGGSHALLH